MSKELLSKLPIESLARLQRVLNETIVEVKDIERNHYRRIEDEEYTCMLELNAHLISHLLNLQK